MEVHILIMFYLGNYNSCDQGIITSWSKPKEKLFPFLSTVMTEHIYGFTTFYS